MLRWAVIGSFLAILMAPVAGPWLTGTQWILVSGSSMEPALERGSILLVDDVAFDEVTSGDIVTVRRGDESLLTHRVVDRDDAGLITRGDANRVADPTPVVPDMLVGRVEATLSGPVAVVCEAAAGLLGRLVLLGAIALAWCTGSKGRRA